jgi:DNA-binding IclR family transcriptional regulator
MVKHDRKSTVNSVLRACRILELFSTAGPELSLSETAVRTGLSRPTAHRLLSTLELAGWVMRSSTGKYRITMRLFNIGASAWEIGSLREVARPVLRKLADLSANTAYLLLPYESQALCVERVEAHHPIRVHSVSVGDRIPLWSGAAPTAMLAFRPDLLKLALGSEELDAAARARLEKRVSEARRRGVVVSPDDLLPGITAVGAPVFDASGDAVAGMSVAGVSEWVAPHIDRVVELVVSAAAELSGLLGYNPDRTKTVLETGG